MTPQTLVSVVLCTYNGESHLRPQLDSILQQTHPHWELIVQDDGSTDRTLEILEAYRENHPDRAIRLYRNKPRLGYNRNFFSAVQHARGELIACCDQDDVWEAEKLAVLVSEMQDEMLIFHNSVLFNDRYPDLGLLHRKPWPRHPHPFGVLINPKAYGHQILFRREALPHIAAFADRNVSYDSLIYTLCAQLGPVRYVDRVLVHWRRHAEATTFTGRKVNRNRLYGYYTALRALPKKQNRRIVRRYFALCESLPLALPDARRMARLMASGSLYNLFRTSLLCMRHRRELLPDETSPAMSRLKAFFLPLFFLRDYGLGIVRD